MTSLCKPVKQAQPLQELMIECLVDYPSSQHQENNQIAGSPKSGSVYWTDDLSVAGTFSSFSRYHTALVFGATIVCSAGAIMQHTETGLWEQSTSVPSSEKNIVQLERTELDADVIAPPIAGPQTNASFSSAVGAADDGEVADTCRDSTCKGLSFIEQRLPDLQEQVRVLRVEMEQFQKQHTAQNLETHRSVLSYRSADVVRRRADLEARSQQLTQQFASLTSALALQTDESRQIANLLNTDSDYQASLQQLQALEYKIAVEYSNPDLDGTQLEILYTEYAQIADQLRQTAQVVLFDYISAISIESPDPLWQEDSHTALLQELMDLAHLQQMLTIEQNTLAQIDEQLTQRRRELAVLLKQYAVMQRQLDGQNKILQQYIAKQQELQNNLT